MSEQTNAQQSAWKNAKQIAKKIVQENVTKQHVINLVVRKNVAVLLVTRQHVINRNAINQNVIKTRQLMHTVVKKVHVSQALADTKSIQ